MGTQSLSHVDWLESDWSEIYSDKVNVTDSKNKPIHKWYPFLEGYSDEFVLSIIDEMVSDGLKPSLCLDPFSGSGTTAIATQQRGIKCISFEINPFIYQLSRAKLRNDYQYTEFNTLLNDIRLSLQDKKSHSYKVELKTIKKKNNIKKWLFHQTAYNTLLEIRQTIDLVATDKYRDLLYIALSSILLQYSNVFRDGKALKYKSNWKKTYYKRSQIINKFLEKCSNEIAHDIGIVEEMPSTINNYSYLYNCDVRKGINTIPDSSLDMIITSPPYLNSRDYTDSYMIELWMLGHINSYEELKQLRRGTLRSHVQVNWDKSELAGSKLLIDSYNKLMKYEKDFWNRNIPHMISGYFEDLSNILLKLKTKLKPQGRIYINVANSSYYGIVFETDRIIAEIANSLGYKTIEIRTARKIKSSSQQSSSVGRLNESVIYIVNQ